MSLVPINTLLSVFLSILVLCFRPHLEIWFFSTLNLSNPSHFIKIPLLFLLFPFLFSFFLSSISVFSFLLSFSISLFSCFLSVFPFPYSNSPFTIFNSFSISNSHFHFSAFLLFLPLQTKMCTHYYAKIRAVFCLLRLLI